MKVLFIWLIRGYRMFISPLFPPSCRFQPTCSMYAIQAIERFGVFRGSWMATLRILRCHPFHPGGYDPVPEVEEKRIITLKSSVNSQQSTVISQQSPHPMANF